MHYADLPRKLLMLLMLMPACPLTHIPERLCRTGISVNGQTVDQMQ
jgi:hypothetical protein